MKNSLKLIALFAIVTVFAVACKKEYTCEQTCVYSTGCGTTPNVVTSFTVKDTKKNAESWCEAYSTTSTVGACTVTCTGKLK